MRFFILFLAVMFQSICFSDDIVKTEKEFLGAELKDLVAMIESTTGYKHGPDFEATSMPDDYQGKVDVPENLIAPANVVIKFKRNIPQSKIDEVQAVIISFDRQAAKAQKQARKEAAKNSAIAKLKALGLTDEEIEVFKN